MKRLKRILSVLLSGTMLFATLSACGTSEKAANTAAVSKSAATAASGTSTNQKHLDITVALWDIDQALANPDNDQFLQAVCKKLNITLKPRQITWDDYTQKAQIWAASGDMPDIMAIDAVGTSYYRNWIDQGVVRALPDDMSKYPTLSKYLDKEDIQSLKENGKLYTVPRCLYDTLDYDAHARNVFYRWDLAQKCGITKEPKTWDEFKTMLKTIVQKDPEQKKICGLTAVNVVQIGGFFWLYSNPAACSDGSGSDFKWIKDDGKYVPAVLDTKYTLPSLQNVREMYEQKEIDPDIAQMKGTQAYDKFVSGKAAAILEVGYKNVNDNINNRWKKLYPDKPLLDSVKRVDYFPSTDGKVYHSTFKDYWSESYFSSKVDDEKMDRIMQLYEYMLQPDTKEFYRFGVKGVDYTKDGDSIKQITSTDDLAKKQPSANTLYQLVEYDSAFSYSDNNKTFDPAILKSAQENLAYSRKVSKIPDYEVKLTYVSTPTKNKFSILDHDFMLKIMTGKEPVDKMWNDTLNGYKAKGLDKMITEVNEKAKEMGLN